MHFHEGEPSTDVRYTLIKRVCGDEYETFHDGSGLGPWGLLSPVTLLSMETTLWPLLLNTFLQLPTCYESVLLLFPTT